MTNAGHNRNAAEQIALLQELISTKVAGETPGQTLMRVSKLILSVRRVGDVGTADWRQWIYEFGERLHGMATSLPMRDQGDSGGQHDE